MKSRFATPTPIAARTLAAVLALLLVLPGVRAARNGIADVYAAPALNYLLYRPAGTPITPSALDSLEDAVGRSIEFAPENPDYLASFGYLEQLKLTLEEPDQSDEAVQAASPVPEGSPVREGSTRASAYYARAAAVRPTWPYDWGDMAIEAYRQGRFDSADFQDALVRVVRFGPWKDDEQLLVLEFGSGSFESLNASAAQAYLANLDRALARQPEQAAAIVESWSLWDAVCARAGFESGAAAHTTLSTLARHCHELAGVGAPVNE